MGLELVTLEAEYVQGVRVRLGSRLVLLELAHARELYRQLGEAIAVGEGADEVRPTSPGTLAWARDTEPSPAPASDPYVIIEGEVTSRETIG